MNFGPSTRRSPSARRPAIKTRTMRLRSSGSGSDAFEPTAREAWTSTPRPRPEQAGGSPEADASAGRQCLSCTPGSCRHAPVATATGLVEREVGEKLPRSRGGTAPTPRPARPFRPAPPDPAPRRRARRDRAVGPHGERVGVVSVVDERSLLGQARHFAPPQRESLIRRASCARRGQPQRVVGDEGCEHVRGEMTLRERQLQLELGLSAQHAKAPLRGGGCSL